jgi:hypothetical protein
MIVSTEHVLMLVALRYMKILQVQHAADQQCMCLA